MAAGRGASLAVAVAAAAALAGCGAGKPEDVAKAYVATNDASKCDMLTQGLVEQLTGRRGEAARAACRRNVVRFPAPEDVRVRAVNERSGGQREARGRSEDHEGGEAEREREQAGGIEAEAEVELIADGREAEVRLVKQHERWRIAALGE
jgi:hypothetical protein